MRALVYHGRNDIRLEQVPEPEIGPGEAKIRVTNTSICATDIEEWKYGPTFITSVPTVLGHEVTGEVVEIGDDPSGLSIGDRVVVDNVLTCGTCYWCQSGSQATCPNMEVAGLGRDGGLQEFMVWPADHLIKLPDTVKDDEAPLLEPAPVALHAVRRSGVRPGDSVAVIGIGTVGALTLQAFKAAGANVYAVDVRPSSLQMATRLGADEVVDAGQGDVGEKLAELTDGIGPDIVVETSGATSTPVNAFDWVRRAGTVVLVGIYSARPEVDFNAVVFKELNVIGSIAAGTGDMRAVVKLVADGKIRLGDLVSDRISLDRVIPDGFERMAADSKDVFRILVSPDA
ncbi:MAG: alcohol dehydrogenase catalytic domain-containing protein [Chloroflexi bacterium]|jgi:(R,R)-butanediol dehydrogenase / meso-butanediol dehydrogenase / diacetyl reductase|nr:alcohol dehydrogenase catalytic domain-containing protein [Chloroflexota bacterium]MBT4072775.1 alcohol dehydrogenase catalytic domain-containing protein [Chloroflexota bacterium]MBT4515489.1 alcohol dehydrogenase catalytic domain-containing protein [Chloroflexota bacterium]